MALSFRTIVAVFAAGVGIAASIAARKPKPASAFAGNHVVITGGSRGLGFVLARTFLQAGANVTICGRSLDSLDRATREFQPFAASFQAIVCDVRDQPWCERFLSEAAHRFGPIDILINNAGVIEVGPLADQTLGDFREAMDTHFWGPLYTSLAVLPAMRARQRGHIVNVASIGGLVGVPHLAPYSASKFAQVGLMQAIAAEVAADGVAVTMIAPGLMRTGSPGHAIFKGRNRAEYAWFTLSDANPALSVAADSAAKTIVRAIQRRRYHATIGWTVPCARVINAVFPQLTAGLLGLAARLLPAASGAADVRHTGDQSRSRWTENPLTSLNTRAERETNQLPVTPPSPE